MNSLSPGCKPTSNKGLVLIDGSYYCFNRYHAIKRWWSFQEESKLPGALPSTSATFVTKFKSTFIPTLLSHSRKHGPANRLMYVASDGPSIWRHALAEDYKAGRDNTKHQDIGFFLELAYRELYSHPAITAVLSHQKLEADDCIALVMRHLRSAGAAVQTLIITSDHDYMQLLDGRTKIVDMEDRNLAESKKCQRCPEMDLFCKIVCGDKSDNIHQVFPRVGPKTAVKLFKEPARLEQAFEKHPGSRERFEHNTKMIDFAQIPEELASQLYATPAFAALAASFS